MAVLFILIVVTLLKAPPTWKIEPHDIKTQEGENEVIHCEASGVPPPQITWFKGKEKTLM